MRVEFDWHVGGENDETETLAHVGRRKRSRPPWWAWLVVATLVTSALTAAYVVVRQRLEAAEDRIIFQI